MPQPNPSSYLVLYTSFGDSYYVLHVWSLYARSILMIIGFTYFLIVSSSILQVKGSMHGYIKNNDGPFQFCEGTHQSVWVHSSSSWIIDRLSHKEQKAIWFSVGLKLSFVLGLILLFYFHRIKMLSQLLNSHFTSLAGYTSWCKRINEAY